VQWLFAIPLWRDFLVRVSIQFAAVVLVVGLFSSRVQAAGAPPVITSQESAFPVSNAPGLPVQFTTAATDPSALPLTFTWNFGDGTSGTGASVTHSFTVAGNYTVFVTASDSSGASTSQSIPYSVQTPLVGTFADSDSDGFPDELEVFLGSSPFDANSTPFTPVTIRSFNITTLNAALRFSRPHRDTVQFEGTLPAAGLDPTTGQTMTFDIGGILRTYHLDQKGSAQAVSSNGNFFESLRVGTVKALGTRNLRFKLKLRGDYAATLAVDGLVNAMTDTSFNFRALVIYRNTLYDKTVLLRYKADKGRSGKARLLPAR
jgi:PKD repeat protein